MVLKIRNGASVAAITEGAISFDLRNHALLLDRVLVLPKAYKNIISVSSMTRNGYMFAIFILEMILWANATCTMTSII